MQRARARPVASDDRDVRHEIYPGFDGGRAQLGARQLVRQRFRRPQLRRAAPRRYAQLVGQLLGAGRQADGARPLAVRENTSDGVPNANCRLSFSTSTRSDSRRARSSCCATPCDHGEPLPCSWAMRSRNSSRATAGSGRPPARQHEDARSSWPARPRTPRGAAGHRRKGQRAQLGDVEAAPAQRPRGASSADSPGLRSRARHISPLQWRQTAGTRDGTHYLARQACTARLSARYMAPSSNHHTPA